MAISETALKNHEELFPNHKSTLKVTDPEPIEVFDNFAFDEVLRYGSLDTRTRLMVILVAMFLIGAAALGLLLIGIHNAWDSVTHIVVKSEGDTTTSSAGN